MADDCGKQQGVNPISGVVPTMRAKQLADFMSSRIRTIGFGLALVSALSVQSVSIAAVDDVQRIVAVVNDEVVSDYDINERIGLILATTGQIESEEQFLELRESVLEQLVDEHLQVQEAFDKELTISDEQVEQRYAEVAARNNVSA